ncbi:helix-turn-helix domain-containing protein [Streptomyces sp. LaPpAH-108]|uniref:helix-turn-helix domain-containing protein n=1 Tax=Streptomyces sp. LaPpAH-108 TaxID=1155714 RepID=UPI00036F7F06|nr:helix-turn-helix domain-containing protein [Streptomyces sp. LaPpAH-108]
MPRWKELPDSLDPLSRQLIVRLRELKDRSGLSLHALETKTGYSRSSWARYLNGRAIPPHAAIEGLARACDADPATLLVLHEIAEPERRQDETPNTAEPPPTSISTGESAPSGPEPPPPARRRLRPAVLIAAALAVALVGAVLLVLAPWQDASRAATASATANSWTPGRVYPCHVDRVDGRLTAGYSTASDGEYQVSTHGWPVVELQCLLRERGFSPGDIDGIYGPATESAVKRFQTEHRLDTGRGQPPLAVDGIVGAHTWGVLRT